MPIIEVRKIIQEKHKDIYGHLNNGKYGIYFDEGREALQKAYRISDEDLIKISKGLWVIHREIDFKQQVFSGQEAIIASRFLPYEKGVKIKMLHEMRSKKGIVAVSKTTHVFVDLEAQKPIRPPRDLVERINHN